MARSWLVRSAALLLCVVAVVAGSTRAAFAHASLEASTPSANSVLEVGPPQIVLDFDEAIEADLTSIALFDGDGRAVDVGKPVAGADSTVVRSDVPALADGIYAVCLLYTSPSPRD